MGEYARLGEVLQLVIDLALEEEDGHEEALVVKLLHLAREARQNIQSIVHLQPRLAKEVLK